MGIRREIVAGLKTKIPDGDVVSLENKLVSRRSTPLTFPSGFLRFNERTSPHCPKEQKHSTAVDLWARPPVLLPALSQASRSPFCVHIHPVVSHGDKNLLINCGDSTLLFWLSSHSDDASSPATEFSVSVRSPFTLSVATPRSPCQSFVSIVAVTVATSLSFAATRGLALIFVRFQVGDEISRHVILQLFSNDVAAIKCATAQTAELARPDHKTDDATFVGFLFTLTFGPHVKTSFGYF